MTDDGLLAVAWKDVGKTKGMSNFHMPDAGFVERRVTDQKEREHRGEHRNDPQCMVEYNKYMGDTDLCDQRRGDFITQCKSKKW